MYLHNQPEKRNNWPYLAAGAAVGFLYAFSIRLIPYLFPGQEKYLAVMSIGFTCLMPFAMGFISVFLAEVKQQQKVATWLMLPWLPLLTALLATIAALIEGLICVVMFTPLALLLATMGGLAGGLAGRHMRSQRSRSISLACMVVLPLLITPWEDSVFKEVELRPVENVIDIAAPAEVIWRNIERVPAIHETELPPSWARRIGFPAPIEATLSHEGVGGVRDASFAGGVLFIETVDVWEPQRQLAFSIRADRIPPTTLDEHVRVGGPYFDVLRGEYRLEPLPNGKIRLHLSSRHRLSTDFNWYAHFWTDAVMSDLQHSILQVIQHRCEAAAAH